ncbi:MAG TPA: hypothetical protein VFI87_06830, partial [Hyphomicrobiaceae bacterium]|nr:hypothetical protein [Hyphomicrobiaceae bacterium]
MFSALRVLAMRHWAQLERNPRFHRMQPRRGKGFGAAQGKRIRSRKNKLWFGPTAFDLQCLFRQRRHLKMPLLWQDRCSASLS